MSNGLHHSERWLHSRTLLPLDVLALKLHIAFSVLRLVLTICQRICGLHELISFLSLMQQLVSLHIWSVWIILQTRDIRLTCVRWRFALHIVFIKAALLLRRIAVCSRKMPNDYVNLFNAALDLHISLLLVKQRWGVRAFFNAEFSDEPLCACAWLYHPRYFFHNATISLSCPGVFL